MDQMLRDQRLRLQSFPHAVGATVVSTGPSGVCVRS
jgi:hypothetical protein